MDEDIQKALDSKNVVLKNAVLRKAADRIEHLEARVLLLKASVHSAWDIIDLLIGLKAKEVKETLEESKND